MHEVNLGGVRRGSEYDQNLLCEMFKELKSNEKKKIQKKNSNYKLKRIRQILKLTNKGYAST